jgi:hypothetical protein
VLKSLLSPAAAVPQDMVVVAALVVLYITQAKL